MTDYLFSAGAFILGGSALATSARTLDRSDGLSTLQSRMTFGLGAIAALLGAALAGWALAVGPH